MKNKEKISFVIPAYNCALTIKESVDSIFDGNFEDGDELIIVNDGSFDETEKIIKDLEVKYYPNVVSINNEVNKGCPASRNIGIKRAKNEFIFNLDSDNILESGSIKKLKDALYENKADVVSFKEYWYFKTDKNKITHKWICREGVFTLSDLLSGFFNPASGGNFMYKKDLWLRIGGYWEYGKGLHEAWGYTFKMLINGAKFVVVPNTYYYHRYSHDSLFVRENKKKDEGINVTNKFIENVLPLLSKKSREYVERNPDWFNALAKIPLILKNETKGNNGKMIYTSPIKQFIYIVKNIIS